MDHPKKFSQDVSKDVLTGSVGSVLGSTLGPLGIPAAAAVNNAVTKPVVDKVFDKMPEEHIASKLDRLNDAITRNTSRYFAWSFILGTFVLFTITIMIWFAVMPSSFGIDKETTTLHDRLVNAIYYSTSSSATTGSAVPAVSNSAKLFMSFYHIILVVSSVGLVLNLKDRHISNRWNQMKSFSNRSSSTIKTE